MNLLPISVEALTNPSFDKATTFSIRNGFVCDWQATIPMIGKLLSPNMHRPNPPSEHEVTDNLGQQEWSSWVKDFGMVSCYSPAHIIPLLPLNANQYAEQAFNEAATFQHANRMQRILHS